MKSFGLYMEWIGNIIIFCIVGAVLVEVFGDWLGTNKEWLGVAFLVPLIAIMAGGLLFALAIGVLFLYHAIFYN